VIVLRTLLRLHQCVYNDANEIIIDGQMNDTRMCLHLALTATQKGACIASRVSVESLTHDDKTGQLNGAIVKDIMTGEHFHIRTRAIVNATGAFADSIRKMDNPDAKPCIKGAAGGMCEHSLPTVLGCDFCLSHRAPFTIFLFIFWVSFTNSLSSNGNLFSAYMFTRSLFTAEDGSNHTTNFRWAGSIFLGKLQFPLKCCFLTMQSISWI